MLENIVITDTSCLIVLSKLSALDLLKGLYNQVSVTQDIADEFGEELPNWVHIRQVKNKTYQELLEATLDRGESSAIALALELNNVLVVIDDLKGRKEAQRLGLKITGTLGIIYAAKQKGLIAEIKPYIVLLQENDFRISPKIIDEILKLSNEL
ncbi:MAG: DUF3368 domain-containing protein [Prevotellaceae bacterium]|jgi:predicted nucleic acid-binding protein|nr:DUF3368 domain-containing protein [Prevotellaceae bacterium]